MSRNTNGRRHSEREIAPLLTLYPRNSVSEPLLSDEDEKSIEDDLELTSPRLASRTRCGAIRSCFKTNTHYDQNEKGRHRTTCCLVRKKACLVVSILSILVSTLVFFIFSLVYFSPVSIPVNFLDQSLTYTPRLLTLNIFMRPPGIKNNENDYKNDRLEYIIHNILPSYDIITIQEAFAFANRRIDHLLAAAFDQGFHYHISSPRHYPWELAGDGGLLILSRFPIKKADVTEFPRGIHSDWLSFKGALHALIQINTTLLHVYTTHTQASYDHGGKLNFDDTQVRLSQFALVHNFMFQTAKNDSYPILLMGDLNVDAAVHNGSPIDIPSINSSLPYDMMMDYASAWPLTNLTDVVYNTFGYHPVTFGDYHRLENSTLVPSETVLTSHNQLLTVQSIDRMLWLGNRGQENTNIRPCNVTVEPFFVDKSLHLPFTQISGKFFSGPSFALISVPFEIQETYTHFLFEKI
ncbi:Endonuclease/exonuclease/phosphatase [Blakeslea trispora]|nr:Endonuclease/exonuclease/phosphatase [Blakeslea trispora]